MKYFIPMMTLGFFAMTFTAGAQSSVLLPHWKFGSATLYQIEDTASGFASETFAVEKATFDKYATNGRIPSSVSAFLLEYPSENYILIDATTGAPNGNFKANLEKAMPGGYKPEKIALVLITHLHGDHIGGLLDRDARRFPNAKVLCSQPEYEYWAAQNNAAFDRVKKAYGDDFHAGFSFNEAINLPGADKPELITITPCNAIGHTPGHAVFLMESEGEKLMVIGDLLHAAAMQFPMPEVCARFDMDAAEAVKARRRILDKAVAENIPVAGMHIPSPGIGFVKKNADGGYRFLPIGEK